jgi:surface protein
VVSEPEHGELTGSAPDLTYTPENGYTGMDAFTFKTNDGEADSNVARISITVVSTNHAPEAYDQNLTTDENSSINITLVGMDSDDDNLSYTIVSGPDHGVLNGDAPNLRYTPNENFYGEDRFTFKVSDGLLDSNVATVLITINKFNHPPIAEDQNVTTFENTSLQITLMASDQDGDELTFSIDEHPSHGTLNGTAPTLTYTPAYGYTGEDYFSYRADDGEKSSNLTYVYIYIKGSAFIIKVRTDISGGSSADDEFIISTNNMIGEYNYHVDCDNNGTNEDENITGNYTCHYNAPGEYMIAIRGDFPAMYMPTTTEENDAIKLLDVIQWGAQKWKSFERAFAGCRNLSDFSANDTPNMEQVTSMRQMFLGATSFNADLNDWNTSNVTDMSGLFQVATSFNGDLDKWDTSNVTNMHGMFNGAKAFNKDISGWDTSKVTDMAEMFANTDNFDQPIGSWNTGQVQSMHRMFYVAKKFNHPIGDWNTSKVTDMNGMFQVATSFNQEIGEWNTSNVTDLGFMFYYALNFNKGLDGWDVSGVTTLDHTFHYAVKFNQNLNDWNTSNISSMVSVFERASSFNGNISSWDTSRVESMKKMFSYATNFNQNIEDWNTSLVENMGKMFYKAESFEDHNLSRWEVENVIDHTDFCTDWGEGNTPPADWDNCY